MTEFELRQGLGRDVPLPEIVESRLSQACAQAAKGARPVRRRRPMRAGRIALAAAVLCAAMCLGAAAAVSLAEVSPEFRAMFGIETPEDEALLGAMPVQQTFYDRNGSGTSITVREVVRDQERVFVLADFAAPEGTVLPEPEPRLYPYADRGYWLAGEYEAQNNIWGKCISYDFYRDKEGGNPATSYYGTGYHSEALRDEDPTDNIVPLLIEVEGDRGIPEEANYLLVRNISALCTERGGTVVPAVDGLDMELVIPINTPAPSYAFEGRRPVNLGGTTLAVAENLVLSPISITMDLIIPDSAAYDEALAARGGAWEVCVLLYDGTKIPLRFQTGEGILDHFYTWPREGGRGELFFRADHVILTPDRPIDLSQIDDIVFAGDNDPEIMNTNAVFHFEFQPGNFFNESYWGKVNRGPYDASNS